jgi:hypothetical protein
LNWISWSGSESEKAGGFSKNKDRLSDKSNIRDGTLWFEYEARSVINWNSVRAFRVKDSCGYRVGP